MRVRIVKSTSIPTVGVSKGVILINPEFFKSLSYQDKAWVLSHETLHVLLRDPNRY